MYGRAKVDVEKNGACFCGYEYSGDIHHSCIEEILLFGFMRQKDAAFERLKSFGN